MAARRRLPHQAYLAEGTVKKRIALIAHDQKKDDMVELASEHADLLRQCILVATGTTGKRLHDEVGLNVERKQSGPYGGDLQIGAELVEGKIDAVIFLRDPMTPQPHEPDINALVRACDVHNIPCATNVSSAKILLAQLVPHHHHNHHN
ncbi:methylglyoxal synthase [Noviherbaspirillum sp. CPCC 100848]|uniref:Methylglyoxal synthase n=1 Tax=Noviherbaspirillum album TaxID=3080276 RepID=A0ABU6J339_9BURK|nr:methylglyoxal synthase [Noviherbaspirillum sp. CPCC 100848]MEC4718051.1 methylglyoxal synthase [Noviherbaspirillum sp. CPCC 100848]